MKFKKEKLTIKPTAVSTTHGEEEEAAPARHTWLMTVCLWEGLVRLKPLSIKQKRKRIIISAM
jgi:hypothetical protein